MTRQACIVALAIAAFLAAAAPATAHDCVVVRATADARNQRVSTERAETRLHRYILHHLRSSTGKSIGPVQTHCIRNACEASAVVCQH